MKIKITGWKEGYLYLKTAKTIVDYTNIKLVKAMDLSNNLLKNNEAFTIEITDEKNAAEFIKKVERLHVFFNVEKD